LAGLAVGGFALGVLVLNPLSRTAQTLMLGLMESREQQLRASPLASCQNAQSLFLLGTDDLTIALHSPYLIKDQLGQRQWHQLTLATADLLLLRTDARTLRFVSPHGFVLGGLLYAMFRPQRSAIPAGARFDLGDATLHVDGASGAGVTELRVELPSAADDPGYCWLRYSGTQLVPVTLPPVGETVTIKWVPGPVAL
jgi:hypothetical protein